MSKTHLPAVLVALGLALVVWRPEWVSVAVLALLVLVALSLHFALVAASGEGARIVDRLTELEARVTLIHESDARNDVGVLKRLAEAEQRIQQAHERLQGMAAPKRGAGL